jgi:hypothetical protein
VRLTKNTQLYPEDFQVAITNSGVVDPSAALDAAVTGLEATARDTALRLVNQRRLAARSIIATQNKLVRAFHKRMPPQVVGKAASQPLALGSLAYIPGTKGLQVFNLLNETFRRSSSVLPNEHTYGAVAGNVESGKFVGGIDAFGSATASIDKALYFPSERVKGEIAQLSEPRIAPIGQIGDKTRGLIVGGANSFGVLKQDCQVYLHATDKITLQSAFLQRTRFAPHGGLSSKIAGYILGGSDQYFGGSLINSIEKIDYAANLASSRYLTSSTPHAHVIHASFGNDIAGYLAGGSNSSPADLKWNSSDITEFPFATETPFLSATKLTNELTCSFGGGSSDAGYVFSGWVDSNLTDLTNSGVFKYRYSDKQAFLVEARLLEAAWDKVAASDYGAGYSYA